MLPETVAINALGVWQKVRTRSLPEAVGDDCLGAGAAFLGDSLLLANWEPTLLSKNPPPEDAFVEDDCLGAGAAFLGDSLLLANWEPTLLSKKPPPEEAFVGEECLGAGAAFLGDSDLVAN